MSTIVDLTLPIHEGMLTYPRQWHSIVEVTQLGRLGVEGRETRKFTLGTHTGTHVDAPRHFVSGGGTVENIPLSTLCGPARIIDCSDVREALQVAHLERVPWPNERILLRFDGDQQWGRMDYYRCHPWIGIEALRFMLDKGVKLIGIDTPSPDRPEDHLAPTHKLLLEKGVVMVEYLCNLRGITVEKFHLIVAPLKLKGGDGAPARVFAVQP